MSVTSFLRASKQLVKGSFQQNVSEKLRIVVGNQSGDLDSIVSAISYAYFSSLYEDRKIIPLLNFPRKELRLRKDVIYLLSQTGIDTEWLFFSDDLPLATNQVEIVLVDHNSMEKSLSKLLGSHRIVGIIDHHVDEGNHLDADPRIIRVTGSCSALVLEYWLGRLGSKQVDSAIFKLLMAPLLVDTSLLTYKTTDTDRNAFAVYQDALQDLDTTQLFSALENEKVNIDDLLIKEIVRKDYKQYEGPNGVIGIGSVSKSFDWLVERDTWQVIQRELSAFCEENQLSGLILLTKFSEKAVFSRQLTLFMADKGLETKLLKRLEDSDLGLALKEENNGVAVYDQRNVGASRKQVAPLVQEVI